MGLGKREVRSGKSRESRKPRKAPAARFDRCARVPGESAWPTLEHFGDTLGVGVCRAPDLDGRRGLMGGHLWRFFVGGTGNAAGGSSVGGYFGGSAAVAAPGFPLDFFSRKNEPKFLRIEGLAFGLV